MENEKDFDARVALAARKMQLNSLWKKTEDLFSEFSDEVQRVMRAEVEEHALEMALETKNSCGYPTFCKATRRLINTYQTLGEIISFVDEHQAKEISDAEKHGVHPALLKE